MHWLSVRKRGRLPIRPSAGTGRPGAQRRGNMRHIRPGSGRGASDGRPGCWNDDGFHLPACRVDKRDAHGANASAGAREHLPCRQCLHGDARNAHSAENAPTGCWCASARQRLRIADGQRRGFADCVRFTAGLHRGTRVPPWTETRAAGRSSPARQNRRW